MSRLPPRCVQLLFLALLLFELVVLVCRGESADKGNSESRRPAVSSSSTGAAVRAPSSSTTAAAAASSTGARSLFSSSSTGAAVNVPFIPDLLEFDLTISNGPCAPDGFVRSCVLVNGQFPGPTLVLVNGGSVRITVRN